MIRRQKYGFKVLLIVQLDTRSPMQDELLNQLEGENLESIGVSPEEITRNYISYLKRISDSRDLQLTVSAMAPCLVYT